MGIINITVLVDFDKVESENGEITNPSECIFMYDDQIFNYYDLRSDKSELGTYVFPGDLLIWGILPVHTNLGDIPFIGRIIDFSTNGPLFNNNENIAPIVYRDHKNACAAISDDLQPSPEKQHYRYRIYIKKIGSEDEYWWDPFIEVRNKDDG